MGIKMFILTLFVVQFALALQINSEPCTVKDIKTAYGECKGIRDIIFYVDGHCNKTGFTIPDPLTNVSCDFSCSVGQYYNTQDKECTTCPTGQQPSKYSELYNKWKTIPDNFVLRSDEGSKDWKAEEFYIRSGGFNQPGQSSFSFDVNIVQDKGELIFIYENSKYYGEQADLIFSLDGIEQRQFYLTSKEWKTVNIPLQFGRHTLTWTYELYSSSLGSEIFEENDPFDGARIRSIEIMGTSQLVLSCELCPSGQQSLNGICVDCQRDSFSNQTGSNSCQPCVKGYYSPAGSSQCFKRPRCTEQDYSVSYGQCELAPTKNTNKDKLMNEQQYQRTRSFFWNSPIVCDPSDVLSKPLPEAQIVQCAPCAPGTYRPIGATNCTACPKGTYRKSNQDNYQLNDESKCDECPAGHAAPQATYIKFPSSIKDQFDQFCEGDNGDRIGCESEGWRSSGDNLVVGGYHTDTHSSGSIECQCWCGCRGITAWLKLNVTVLPGEEGSVQFRFKPKIGKDSALIFYSTTSYNNPIVFDIDRLKQEGGDIEDERVVQVTLHPEDKTLNWIYIRRERYQSKMNKYDYINNDDGIPITHPTADTVSITSILLQNVDNAVGGSTECTACPSGTYSESIGAQKCEQCGKGYYSPKASQQCQICQEGYYQTRVKQETCEKCGGTTHSSLDRQHCELQEENICGFKESDQLRFNLDRINKKNGMWEARINDQQMRMNDDTSTVNTTDPTNITRYFINICSMNQSKQFCKNSLGRTVSNEALVCEVAGGYGQVSSFGDMIGFQYIENWEKQKLYNEENYQTYNPKIYQEPKLHHSIYNRFIQRVKNLIQFIMKNNKFNAYNLEKQKSNDVEAGISVSFYNGDLYSGFVNRDIFINDTNGNNTISVPRKAELRLICDPKNGLGDPVLIQNKQEKKINQINPTTSTVRFEWRTEAACPLCTQSDYDVIKTPCKGGQQRLYYQKNPDAKCVVVTPESQQINEEDEQQEQPWWFSWNFPQEQVIKCKEGAVVLTIIEVIVIISLVILTAIGLVLTVFFLYRRNKSLYQKLVNQGSDEDEESENGWNAKQRSNSPNGNLDDDDDDTQGVEIKQTQSQSKLKKWSLNRITGSTKQIRQNREGTSIMDDLHDSKPISSEDNKPKEGLKSAFSIVTQRKDEGSNQSKVDKKEDKNRPMQRIDSPILPKIPQQIPVQNLSATRKDEPISDEEDDDDEEEEDVLHFDRK